MKLTRWVLVVITASIACRADAIDWSAHFGPVVRDQSGRLCVTAYRGALTVGDSLWVVSGADGSQRVARGVAGPAGGCDALHSELEDVFPVMVAASSSDSPYLGIAAWGARPTIEVRDGEATTDLDEDAEPEHFGFCTSQEGVHLTVWTGSVGTGVRRWHKYHQLFYDVEPSCTESEMKEPYS